jgi:gentisate 1,2-dioxygenase
MSVDATSNLANANAAAGSFETRLRARSMAPLWEVFHQLITPQPQSPAKPAQWKYADVRPLVMEGGELISAAQAERRVLILENPALPGRSAITSSLYAGVQLVMPGETARAHIHTASALRIIIEGEGGYTTVDSDRVLMYPGDVVLTPSWTWHEHGNLTDTPMVWLDGLDVQLVNALDGSFMQPGPAPDLAANAHEAGAALGPLDRVQAKPPPAPRRYGYEETLSALRAAGARAFDPWHGVRLRFLNPATGDWPMPTMGAFAQSVAANFQTERYRSTDGSIFFVAEGAGAVTIDGQKFALSAKDIFVVPAWAERWFEADEDLVLLAFSDRPAQEKLGLWREDRVGQMVQSL